MRLNMRYATDRGVWRLWERIYGPEKAGSSAGGD
jgi:hypothetical protein